MGKAGVKLETVGVADDRGDVRAGADCLDSTGCYQWRSGKELPESCGRCDVAHLLQEAHRSGLGR